MIVLDTNVLSESLRPAPAKRVLTWLDALASSSVYTTTITQAEILYGLELLPAGKRRTRLLAAVEEIFRNVFPGRILPFDEDAARVFATLVMHRKRLGRPISQFDAVIASICRSRGAAIATRNVTHFEDCGLSVVNPWSEDEV